MATTEELVNRLIEEYPEDAEDLRDALTVLLKQKLGSCERLARLGDNQWQRLAFPMGIESILMDTVSATQVSRQAPALATASAPPTRAPQPAPSSMELDAPLRQAATTAAYPERSSGPTRGFDEDNGELPLEDFEDGDTIEPYRPEGLHQRRGAPRQAQHARRGRTGGPAMEPGGRTSAPPLLKPIDLQPPADLEALWHSLLEDTLPPDKRASLQSSWTNVRDPHDRYMMFLEYSSYLRQPEMSEEEKAARKKELEPLMREYGIKPDDEDDSGLQGTVLWWLVFGAVFLFAAIVYYAYTRPDPLHDLQTL